MSKKQLFKERNSRGLGNLQMIRSFRNVIAFLLVVVYSLIIMGPLAPIAFKSPRVAHAVTGECSGNCDICGCAAERRANHTCCCWINKMKKEREGNNAFCCKKKTPHRMAMISCNCPCGGNKQPLLSGLKISDHLPYSFDEVVVTDDNTIHYASGDSMPDRCFDPPDPPPKLPSTT